MTAIRRIPAVGVCALAAIGLSVARAKVDVGRADDHVMGGPGASQDAPFDPGIRTAAFHRYTIPFISSLNGTFVPNLTTETIVKIINDSDRDIEVMVVWNFAFGGVAGTSGPLVVGAHQSEILSTINLGEDPSPFFMGGDPARFRDTTNEVEGYARVFVGPVTGSARNVTCTAFLMTGLGLGQSGIFGTNARTVTALHVNRAGDPDGDGIDDTRFKGD